MKRCDLSLSLFLFTDSFVPTWPDFVTDKSMSCDTVRAVTVLPKHFKRVTPAIPTANLPDISMLDIVLVIKGL